MAVFNATLAGKRIELTKELIPTAAVIGYLLHPADQGSATESKGALAAARALGIELKVLNASSEDELETAFAAMAKLRADALVVAGEPFFDSKRERIVALSARGGVAAVYPWREYVLAGGLISYGTDLPESYREAAIYAGRILKGEKPARLAVKQPTKFRLAVNLKTAKALGLEIPSSVLARADERIE
jgi:putative tryptophan/tyrosine transport system substrate-binding protein